MTRSTELLAISSLLVPFALVGGATAADTKLAVLSRHGLMRIKYVSSDPTAGLPGGPGAGTSNVALSFIINQANMDCSRSLWLAARRAGGSRYGEGRRSCGGDISRVPSSWVAREFGSGRMFR